MLKINYTLKSLSPIVFAEQSGDAVLTGSKRFVPGSVVRGAFAELYLQQLADKSQAHKDEGFRKLFLLEQARFLPAYPSAKQFSSAKETIVCPLSLMKDKEGVIVKDYSLQGTQLVAGFKKKSGFVILDKENNSLEDIKAKVQVEFHMSRSKEKERIAGKSTSGQIFNYEYLEAFQYFRGSIIVDDACAEMLMALLPEKGNSLAIKVGRSRTSQYGACELTVESMEAVHDIVQPQADELYLYLQTPYIPESFDGLGAQLVDEAFADILANLEQLLEASGTPVKLTAKESKIFAAVEPIDGYVGVWNTKRERVNAIAAGSLCKLAVQDLNAVAFKNLHELLYAGLGARTGEGFGQMRLWQPLQNVTLVKKQEAKADALALDLAQIIARTFKADTKALAKKIVLEKMLNVIRNKAKADSVDIKVLSKDNTSKTSLKRIEFIMDTPGSKAEIIARIEESFHKPAQDNLGRLNIGNSKVWESLIEIDREPLYLNINWAQRLGLTQAKEKALLHILGVTSFRDIEDIDLLYKEYWFWLARHAVKNASAKGR